MKVLWAGAPRTASEIIQELAAEKDWHPNTVKTLLSRLHRKGAVSVQKEKNLYLYRPVVTEARCVQVESQSFLERFFGGAVKPLLVHFAERQKLSTRDLQDLKDILKKKQK